MSAKGDVYGIPGRNACPVKARPKATFEVQLPYGEAADGRLLHISEVSSGLACGCKCPACKADLIARKGPIQQHNFAHRSDRACAKAYETTIHQLAKQIIGDNRRVGLPAVEAVLDSDRHILYDGQVFELMEVDIEK